MTCNTIFVLFSYIDRWLSARAVLMEGEGKCRFEKKVILGNATLTSEMVPFLFKENGETVTKLAPIITLTNLKEHILHTLDELDR